MRIHFYDGKNAGDYDKVRAAYGPIVLKLRSFEKEGKITIYIAEINDDESWAMNSPGVKSGYYPEAFTNNQYPYASFTIYVGDEDMQDPELRKQWETWITEQGLALAPYHNLEEDPDYMSRVKRHYEFLKAVRKQDVDEIKKFLSEERGISFEDMFGKTYMNYATFEHIALIGDYARTHKSHSIREASRSGICTRCGRLFEAEYAFRDRLCTPCTEEVSSQHYTD
jgi:hypothetical protein